jgi:hypothetical protein
MIYDIKPFTSEVSFNGVGIGVYGDSRDSGTEYEERRLGSGGGDFQHPFRITTSVVGGQPKYRVAKASIQNGTNGTLVNLSDIFEEDRDATAGYVVLEADVSAESGGIENWALVVKATPTDAAKEVEFTTTPPISQNKIRLFIGKLTVGDGVVTAWQAQFSSVRIGYSVVNGVPAYVFEDAPTHPTVI